MSFLAVRPTWKRFGAVVLGWFGRSRGRSSIGASVFWAGCREVPPGLRQVRRSVPAGPCAAGAEGRKRPGRDQAAHGTRRSPLSGKLSSREGGARLADHSGRRSARTQIGGPPNRIVAKRQALIPGPFSRIRGQVWHRPIPGVRPPITAQFSSADSSFLCRCDPRRAHRAEEAIGRGAVPTACPIPYP